MLVAGIIFVLYATTSSLVWGEVMPVLHLASLVACFIAGHQFIEPRPVWIIFSWVTIALSPLLWLIELNPNMYACAVVLALAGAIAYQHLVVTPALVALLLWTQSRGAILATGLMTLIVLWRRFPVTAYGVLCLALILVLSLKSENENQAILSRLGIWQDTLNHLTFWGSGWGTFFDAYSTWDRWTNMTLMRPPHAYNDALEILFELGVGSIALWVFIVLAFEGRDPNARLIVLTFLALGLTYFPLYLYPLGQLGAFALGSLAASRKQEGPSWLDGFLRLRTTSR